MPDAIVSLGFRDQASTGINQVGSNLSSLAGPAAIAAGAITGVAAAGLQLANRFAENASEIGRLRDQLGLSAEQLSQYRFQLQQTGAEFDDLREGLLEYNRLTLEGNEETLAAITALGLSFDQLDSVSAEERIRLIAEAIQEIDNATLKQSLLEKLFGESDATNLFGFFDRFNELSEVAANSAPIIDDEDIAKAQAFEKAIGELEAVVEDYSKALGEQAAPAITAIVTALTDLEDLSGGPDVVLKGIFDIITLSIPHLRIAEGLLRDIENLHGLIQGETPQPGFGGPGGAFFGAPIVDDPPVGPGLGGNASRVGEPEFLARYQRGPFTTQEDRERAQEDLGQRYFGGLRRPARGGERPYTVQGGDTLTAIARAQGTSIAALQGQRGAGTDPNLIFPGEELGVPGLPTVEQVEEQGEAVQEEVVQQYTAFQRLRMEQRALAEQQRQDALDQEVAQEGESIAAIVAQLRAGHEADLLLQQEQQNASLASRIEYWLEYDRITAAGVSAANASVAQLGSGQQVAPMLQFGNIGQQINTPITDFINADNAAEVVAMGTRRLRQQGRSIEQ